MVDTMLLHYILPRRRYDDLFKAVNKIAIQKNKTIYPDSKIRLKYKTDCFYENGILEFSFYHYRYNYNIYLIELKFCPKLLINPDDILNVTHYHEVDLVEKNFNDLMKSISSILPQFNMWNCVRVDYAVNIETPHPEIYIKLFKLGNIRKTWQERMEYIWKYTGSFYLPTKKRYITINFYSKYDQLTKKEKYNQDINKKKFIEKATNVLRLEVQCRVSKLATLRKSMGLPDSTPSSFLKPQIAFQVISSVYKMLTMNSPHDFTSLKKSMETLADNNVLPSKVLHLADCLRRIRHAKGLTRFKNSFCKGNDNLYRRIMREFEYIGLCPIVIPARHRIDRLPNLNTAIHFAIFQPTDL